MNVSSRLNCSISKLASFFFSVLDGHVTCSVELMGCRVADSVSCWIVQGVKDKKKLLASDLYQSLKICIHGQFHILN